MENLDKFPAVVAVDVRYRDLDTFNHVNNAVYLTYFEQARVRYFRSLGWRSNDASVVVARSEVNYRKPIFLGDDHAGVVRAPSERAKVPDPRLFEVGQVHGVVDVVEGVQVAVANVHRDHRWKLV